MIRYVFRDDEPLKIKGAKNADPQVIGERLQALTDKAGGDLKPEAVVEEAADKNSPLHPHFEWDDKLAAHAHRLDQARSLIRIVRVADDEAADGTARAFLSVATDRGGVSYRPMEAVKKSADLQLAVLKAAERDLQAFEARYRDLLDVCDLVRDARERVRGRRTKIETRAH